MRRIVVGFMGTLSALVLLFSYHTSLGASTSSAGDANTDANTDAGPNPDPAADPSADPSTGAGTADPGSSGASASETYTGDAVDTRWGPVQVRITVQDGRITKSEAVVYPNGNGRDQEINAYAVPALNREAVEAQSSKLDALSGATVTSDGYIQSLQSAIDQANL